MTYNLTTIKDLQKLDNNIIIINRVNEISVGTLEIPYINNPTQINRVKYGILVTTGNQLLINKLFNFLINKKDSFLNVSPDLNIESLTNLINTDIEEFETHITSQVPFLGNMLIYEDQIINKLYQQDHVNTITLKCLEEHEKENTIKFRYNSLNNPNNVDLIYINNYYQIEISFNGTLRIEEMVIFINKRISNTSVKFIGYKPQMESVINDLYNKIDTQSDSSAIDSTLRNALIQLKNDAFRKGLSSINADDNQYKITPDSDIFLKLIENKESIIRRANINFDNLDSFTMSRSIIN